MQLEWLGQLCPPGQYADLTGICRPVPGIPQPGQVLPTVDVPPGVVITPAPPPSEEKSKALVYAAVIVASGIIAAVALSRFA